MQRTRIANGVARLAAAGVLVATSASAAFATVYPVSGKWTYENAAAQGPARTSSSILMPVDGHFCRAAAREARPTYYRS
jgi:hypothetical protein